jgi:hypothetical protein
VVLLKVDLDSTLGDTIFFGSNQSNFALLVYNEENAGAGVLSLFLRNRF